jgi:hypothetical protein
VTKEVTNEVREVAKYVIDNGDLVIITMKFYWGVTTVSRTRIPLSSITGHSLSTSYGSEHELTITLDNSLIFENEIFQNGGLFQYQEIN